MRQLRLDNLPVSGSVTMVAEMLHVDPATAAGLAEVIRTAHVRQPVRDGGAAQRAAPRRRADRDGGRVAVGRGGGARSPGPVRGGRAVGGAGRGHAGTVPADGGGDGVPGRASRAEPAAGRHRRAGGRGGTGAGARPGRRPAGGGARGASGGAVPPRPDPRGGPGRAGPAAAAHPAAGHGAAAGRRAGVVRGRGRSSTCRWSTRSTTPRSGVRWWGCCGAPPTRRR